MGNVFIPLLLFFFTVFFGEWGFMGGKLQFVEHCKSEQEPNYTYTNYLANEKIYMKLCCFFFL